ncbi:hypothetical protein GCM10010271_46320 [Streptomyces kurssanovii]|nr:hypothetical protein GCM10010271_46320 [Streptomyces kurssanovii]
MPVRTESLPHASNRSMRVRVHTPIGVAVVRWHGDPQEADGHHLVEWTVDEDIHWGLNTHAVFSAEPELRQEDHRVIMRGILHLDEAGPWLQLGDWPVLLDMASPVHTDMDGSWVEISVEADHVGLYPYRI